MADNYSFKDVVSKLNIGEGRARRMRDRFIEVIPHIGEGRRRRYLEGASKAISLADRLDRDGLDDVEIISQIKSVIKSKVIDIEPNSIEDRLDELYSEIARLKEENRKMKSDMILLSKYVVKLKGKLAFLESRSFSFSSFWNSIVRFIDDILDF